MKKITFIVSTFLCLTILMSVTGCSKDGDGKIEFTSERRELPKRPGWTFDGRVDEPTNNQQQK